jgi:hypothetical protein
MHANPMPAGVHHSHSDRMLRRVLGVMSLFTMFMTIPQVMTIWIGHQAAGLPEQLHDGSPLRFECCPGWAGAMIAGPARGR